MAIILKCDRQNVRKNKCDNQNIITGPVNLFSGGRRHSCCVPLIGLAGRHLPLTRSTTGLNSEFSFS